MNHRLCLCGCQGVLRNRGRYISGHNQFNGKLWKSTGRGDPNKGRGATTVYRGRDAALHDDFAPDPSEWYRAEYDQVARGLAFYFYRLSNLDKVYVHRTLMPSDAGTGTILVRLERSPSGKKGAKWRALEVLADNGESNA